MLSQFFRKCECDIGFTIRDLTSFYVWLLSILFVLYVGKLGGLCYCCLLWLWWRVSAMNAWNAKCNCIAGIFTRRGYFADLESTQTPDTFPWHSFVFCMHIFSAHMHGEGSSSWPEVSGGSTPRSLITFVTLYSWLPQSNLISSLLFFCPRIWRRCCLSPRTLGSSCTRSCMPARRSCCSASSPPSSHTSCTTGKKSLSFRLQGSQHFSLFSTALSQILCVCVCMCVWSALGLSKAL